MESNSVAQMGKNLLAIQKTVFDPWVEKTTPQRRE